MTGRWLPAVVGLVVGVVLVLGVQSLFEPGPAITTGSEGEEPTGPHGGRLLEGDPLTLEVTIYEEGVEPRFRVYPIDTGGDPVRPADVQLTATLERLGGIVEQLTFTPESDYLRSDQIVGEPHSFSASFTAVEGGRTTTFGYEQVEGRTEIGDDALASTGIEVATATGGRLEPWIELPGEIVLPPDSQVTVAARASGILTELPVRIGQVVEQGDVLAVLSSPDLTARASAYAAARARLQFARAARDREADLVKRRITALQDLQLAEQALTIAEAEVHEAREALAALGLDDETIESVGAERAGSRLPIVAPTGGVITAQSAAPGESIAAGAPLLTITDTTDVWVNVQVHARDLDVIGRGSRVTVHGVGTSREAVGSIATVSPLVGESTRTATARVVLPNAGGAWHPGLFATVRVALEPVDAEVVVPVDAIQTFRDWTVVFVRVGDLFEARPIESGRSDGRLVEVLSGLRPGERYAATNAYAVKADVLKSGAGHDH